MAACEIDGCDAPVFVKARGWCRTHYYRWHRTGDPLRVAFNRIDGTPLDRWWAKVEKQPDDGCWLWIGSLDKHGYGQFDVTLAGVHKNHRAHRWGYQQLVRPLADEETIDHLCRVHACVRPDHLDPVSHAENVDRGDGGAGKIRKMHCNNGHPIDSIDSRGVRFCSVCRRDQGRERARRHRGYKGNPPNGAKTHCSKGHEFTPENTIVRKDGRGRGCRECLRAAMRDYMRRRRASQ